MYPSHFSIPPELSVLTHRCRIDPSVRLRRAITLRDAVLVRRILKTEPKLVQNPDFGDKANTSLHLAARLGELEISEILLDAGHEENGLTRNTDWDTPLNLAAAESHDAVVHLLATRYPRALRIGSKNGLNPLMAASRAGKDSTVQILLDAGADVNSKDVDGNTALHYASAYGCLKVIRTLISAGALPHARNAFSWTPISYSATVAAEVYFKNLVAEFEAAAAAAGRHGEPGGQPWVPPERAVDPRLLKARGGPGVRLVTEDESFPAMDRSQTTSELKSTGYDGSDSQYRLRANSGD